MATMAQAKRDFENGFLKSYVIKRYEIGMAQGENWFVWLGYGLGSGSSWLVDARDGDPREFKTLDAAVRAVEQVGFRVTALGGSIMTS